ncbi:MAG: VUT family protein, partial [Pseudomonadota bacterium]
AKARQVVFAGFLLAVILSVVLATPRIAIASGTAFLLAQLLDVTVFDKLRQAAWWRAPLVSSFAGSAIDTVLFFSIAFAASLSVFGANDDFAIANAPLLGAFGVEAPRWVSWALGDFAVKLLMALVLLAPYRFLRTVVDRGGSRPAAA